MTDETYEGWSNRETWAVALWINNDQGLSEITREMAVGLVPFAVADAIEAMFDEFHDEVLDGVASLEQRRMILDIGSFGRVDWREVADGVCESVTA